MKEDYFLPISVDSEIIQFENLNREKIDDC